MAHLQSLFWYAALAALAARMYSLSPNTLLPAPMSVTRLDDRTLRVAPEGGYPWLLFRSAADPFSPGDRVELGGMTVEILKTKPNGVPLEVDFEFPAPLEDPMFIWMRMDGLSYVPFTPPAIGETIRLGEPDKKEGRGED